MHSRISRFQLSHVSDIVSHYTTPGWILSLAVDFTGGTVYWHNREALEIRASDLDLGNVRQIVSMSERGHFKTRGLAVYESSIYWVTVNAAIFRADKVTGDNIEAVSERLFENPFGLFIYNDPETETSAECITPTTIIESTPKRGSCVSTNNTQVTRGYFRKLFNSDGQEICLLDDQRINSVDSLKFIQATTCAIKCLRTTCCEGFVVNNHPDNKFCSLLDKNPTEASVTKDGCITYRKILIV